MYPREMLEFSDNGSRKVNDPTRYQQIGSLTGFKQCLDRWL